MRSMTMTVTPLIQRQPRELAFRASDGVEVTLAWHEDTDQLSVVVWDQRRGRYFELRPARERALDAFHHPYMHVASSVAYYEEEPLAA
jgi:hypothetical protein